MRPAQPAARDFAAALLDATQPAPRGLRAWNGSDPTVRFAVYRNNVVHSLASVLADTYPVVRQLVGDAFFDAMARLYLVDHPPTSPPMHRYGAALPRWIADFEPAASLPYLADLASLEWSRLCAFHAADAWPIEAGALQALLQEPQRLEAQSLTLHASTAVLQSAHPVVSLWAAHQVDDVARDDALGRLDQGRAESALVFRDTSDQAVVLALPGADAALLGAMAAGLPLGQALASNPLADFAGALSLLLQHGLVTGLGTPKRPSPALETSA